MADNLCGKALMFVAVGWGCGVHTARPYATFAGSCGDSGIKLTAPSILVTRNRDLTPKGVDPHRGRTAEAPPASRPVVSRVMAN
jgi:hypothetical protein